MRKQPTGSTIAKSKPPKAQGRRVGAADIARIMQVAGRLFAEHGYEGVGVREIARESGVVMPSILYHFGSKAELYEEVLEYKYRAHSEAISRDLRSIADPRQRLEFIVGALFDALLEDEVLLLLLQRDVVEIVARKKRPEFARQYEWFAAAAHSVMQASLGTAVDKGMALSLLSLVLGFCELTAALGADRRRPDEWNAWYAERRSALIALAKKMFDV